LVAFICKLCRGTDVARSYVLQRHMKVTEPFVAAMCARCGLFQNVYDWQEAARVQESLKLDLAYRLEPFEERQLVANQAKARAFAKALDELGLVRGKRILDIGCGKGHFLRECLSLGATSVAGQDFFRGSAIAYAKNELSIYDIRSVPFEDRAAWPDAEFDVVCSFDVIEHIHDLAGFFREATRVTKPDGALFHATPGCDSLTNRLGRFAVGRLGGARHARTIGTWLCNLQPDDTRRGGSHVSLLGRRPLGWLVASSPLSLEMAYYMPSYSNSNRHYARLTPGLNRLPPAFGAAAFAILRRLIRNKLVFLARRSGELSPSPARSTTPRVGRVQPR
jgi:2-polyprenyl-3-methyl-5-hydroxy-6-metoxy-1,4-benzoquinol methylase